MEAVTSPPEVLVSRGRLDLLSALVSEVVPSQPAYKQTLVLIMWMGLLVVFLKNE